MCRRVNRRLVEASGAWGARGERNELLRLRSERDVLRMDSALLYRASAFLRGWHNFAEVAFTFTKAGDDLASRGVSDEN